MIKSGWYICPYCNKRLFPVQDDTIVKNLPQKCRACKHIFLVQINNTSKENEISEKVNIRATEPQCREPF